MKSATHKRLGAVAVKSRSTRSVGPLGALVGDRRAPRLAADDARQPGLAHQPLDRAARHRDALGLQLPPHLPRAVEAARGVIDAADLRQQLAVAQRPRRRPALAFA